MIRFEDVSVTYDRAAAPVLSHVDLHVPEGELVLVVGRTGTGKSTLLRCVNGLVPHFTGGTLSGRVTVAGRDTRLHPPRELADVVGVVPQDPLSGFVTDMVEDELAYGMESIGLAPDVMRRRVEETLDLLGLAELRNRPLRSLSGGQRQRVAIGAVLTMHPRVLVLDEPTSALDPGAAEEVLAALQRLVHDLGVTVLLAEHRLERVVQYADRVVVVPGAGEPLVVGTPAEVMATAPVAPPVVELGRLAGWTPLPLSVRDARRAAGPLRDRLEPQVAEAAERTRSAMHVVSDQVALSVSDAVVRYGATPALRGITIAADRGEIVAVMGRNGAGKSTLLGTLVGLHVPTSGSVAVGGVAPSTLRGRDLVSRVGLVPQEPTDLLVADRVGDECTAGDRDGGAVPGTTRSLLDRLATGVDDDAHPRDLSEGQRLALALAVVLASKPPVLLLDEPTRGLDYAAKKRLVTTLRSLAADGHCVVLATHDVELAAEVATRVVVVAEGEVVADGPATDVVIGSPMFAPQVSKVMAPQPWLTVAEVAAALVVAS
ncbi:MAG TPA: ATP-binding cassette domain-containing protein [Candidatus Nanopelagicales bacterium]|nr:ATP-binding cassette domain-containing protein [Candidatus Nanopelagicales bacterium]